jgi:cysteine desulfuration protein SufE
MKLGQRMPKLSDGLKHSEAEIRGCESQTWLYHHEQEGKHFFLADSEARIVRGLLVLLLAACNGKTSEELKRVKVQDWFEALGIQTHLSPSRTNGLRAILERIKAI